MQQWFNKQRLVLANFSRTATVPHMVAFLSLILLALVTFLLWLEMKKRFPMLPPGVYVGKIEGIFKDDGVNADVRFLVERSSDSDDLALVVVRPGWVPQVVSAALPEREGGMGTTAAQDWLLPITVAGIDGKLRFVGSKVGPAEFVGRVQNIETDVDGSWSLAKVRAIPSSSDPQEIQEIRHWLFMKAELGEVERQISEAQAEAPRQQKEIEKLTGFVTEGERLKSSAEEKYVEVKDLLSDLKNKVKGRQEEARGLEEQTMLSQRLTGMGRLVSLARESLEREGRWVESMLRADSGSLSPDVEDALRQSEKVQKLREQLAIERGKIAALRAPGAGDGNPKVGEDASLRSERLLAEDEL